MAAIAMKPVLSEELLARFGQRAARYDRESRFFTEDFEELRDAGYLTGPVPVELGGQGLTLADFGRDQRRLAYHAHATALGINMHLYWVGLAADLWRAGGRGPEGRVRGAIQGEGFSGGR